MQSVRARALAALAVGLVGAVAGCGSGLSESSSCSDYLGAPGDQQQSVVQQLAGKYRKPDYATPLGMPEVAYYCAGSPNTTLKQFFEAAQD
jgi:hypothetical protein